jgi:hypothetical protein
VRVLRDVMLEARVAQRAGRELRVEGHRADGLVDGGVFVPGLAREEPRSAHGDGVPETERHTSRRVENMVGEAVICELVSDREFPAKWERTGNLAENGPISRKLAGSHAMISMRYG